MSGLLAVWCVAVCFIVLFLPGGDGTGAFEVQLTSLINGWGLTHDGHCCSHHHNHIRNRITNTTINDNDIHNSEGWANINDDPSHSGNKMRERDIHNSAVRHQEGEREREREEEEYEDEGEEWSCEEECRTFLRVCLSHLRDPLPTGGRAALTLSTMCTFGSAVSLVLGGNTLDPFGTWQERSLGGASVDPATVVRVPFTFSWPAEYTVVVEAWHDEHGNRTTQDTRHLIARAVQGGELYPSTLWQNHSATSINTDLSFRFRVACDSNYYGDGCDVLCRESDDPIIGHYACDSDGSRICLPGWEGESCDRAQCSEECLSGHGFCEVPHQCRCRLGWRGADCSQCQTFPRCLHGYCNEAWQCLCHQGWSGSLCDIDNFYCDRHRPCENGGTCAYDSITNYTCTCPQGYGGKNCQHSVCYHGHCLNDGVCVMRGGIRSCRCRRGYEGTRCQHAEVTCGSVSCRNNGTCTRQGPHFRCLCRPGFTGSWCQDEIDECLSSPCQNGGLCRDRVNGYHCECTPGHAGRNCDLALDPCMGFKCFNHGTCITIGAGFTPSCLCLPEFSGPRCEMAIDPCVGIACLHGGSCIRTGPSFHCACANRYTGRVCQIPPPSLVCRDQPCLNGGACRRTQNGVIMCVCLPGFEGALCEERRSYGDVFSSTARMEYVTRQEQDGQPEPHDLEVITSEGEGLVEDPGGGDELPRNFQVPADSASVTVCRNYGVLLVVTVFWTVNCLLSLLWSYTGLGVWS